MNELKKLTRVEVIDQNGRSYTQSNCKSVQASFQDDGRTLKIFINKTKTPLVYEYLEETGQEIRTLYMTEAEWEEHKKNGDHGVLIRKIIAPDSFQK